MILPILTNGTEGVGKLLTHTKALLDIRLSLNSHNPQWLLKLKSRVSIVELQAFTYCWAENYIKSGKNFSF